MRARSGIKAERETITEKNRYGPFVPVPVPVKELPEQVVFALEAKILRAWQSRITFTVGKSVFEVWSSSLSPLSEILYTTSFLWEAC